MSDSLMERMYNIHELMKVRNSIEKVDEQSADLLAKVWIKLNKETQVARNVSEAINRLDFVLKKYKNVDPSLLRNNIFKAANALGIKLPSGMFASQDEVDKLARKFLAKKRS